MELYLPASPVGVMEAPDQLWYTRCQQQEVGLGARVAWLLAKLG